MPSPGGVYINDIVKKTMKKREEKTLEVEGKTTR